MVDIIESVNILLAENGYPSLKIRLSYSNASKFEQDKYGTIKFYGYINAVNAVFELLEFTNYVQIQEDKGLKPCYNIICSNRNWLEFLFLIEKEFGSRFMRQVGLDRFKFDSKTSEED